MPSHPPHYTSHLTPHLPHPRLVNVSNSLLYAVHSDETASIADVDDGYWTLRVEVVPPEEVTEVEGERNLRVAHFKKGTVRRGGGWKGR